MNWTPAGEFDKRVQLQRATAAAGPTGESVKNWVTYATVWAKFITDRGTERLAAQQVKATVTVEIRLRYRSGILPSDRIKFGSRILDIKSAVDIDERHVELRLQCMEAL
jgi:SPP1 family predicted phage head-tail adaptor